MGDRGLDRTGSGQGQVAGGTKGLEVLDWLRNCKLLKDSAAA